MLLYTHDMTNLTSALDLFISTLFLTQPIAIGFMSLVFLRAKAIKNMSIADIVWGVGFALLAITTYWIGGGGQISFVLTMLTLVWGVRLAAHIALRNHGKGEDPRYAAWRKDWGSWVDLRGFLQVFVLQAILMTIIVSPVTMTNLWNPNAQPSWLTFLGIAIWGVGFFFEAVSDHQLLTFKRIAKNKGKLFNKGLWRYSRHPNYFGEATQWWGVFLISTVAVPWQLAIIGPILITYLLLQVSGVTLTEQRKKGKPAYEQYKKTTSPFIPWFPKR